MKPGSSVPKALSFGTAPLGLAFRSVIPISTLEDSVQNT